MPGDVRGSAAPPPITEGDVDMNEEAGDDPRAAINVDSDA
jgi:hypothetical protein